MGGLTGAFDVDGIGFAGFTPRQILIIKNSSIIYENLL